LVFAFLPAASATAEERPREREISGTPRNRPEIERVHILMNAGNFQGAAAYLEVLSESDADNPVIKDLLAACYKKTGEYLKLLNLLKARLKVEGRRYDLVRDYGHAHLLNGDIDSALIYFFEAIPMVGNRSAQIEFFADALSKLGYHEQEIELIDSVRKIFDDPGLLAVKRGDAMAARKEFAAAAGEYLHRIERDTLENPEAVNKLLALLEFPQSVDTVMAVLTGRIRGHSSNRVLMDTYGRVLLEQDRYDDAFNFYRERDSIENGTGGGIVQFMRECGLRDRYDHVIKAGQYLIEQYPESSLRMVTRLIMAEAYTELGQYQQALDNYNTVIEKFRRPADKADAQIRIGWLYKDHLNNLAKAKENFDQVLRTVPRSRYGIFARFGLADVYVRERNFDSAIIIYDSLLNSDVAAESAEEAEYFLGRSYLYKGLYEEADRHFRRLINTYPKGFFVNDAIQLALILGETLDQARDHIDLFSSSEYFLHVGQSDSLEYYLTKICRVGIPSLAPISFLRLAQLCRDQNRLDEALAAIDSLIAAYPNSYYFPFGFKVKADILWETGSTRDQARAIYKDLLGKYGSYPFAAEIRDILRRDRQINQL
jgi:tetratricopeptide (TPR) repeat protein